MIFFSDIFEDTRSKDFWELLFDEWDKDFGIFLISVTVLGKLESPLLVIVSTLSLLLNSSNFDVESELSSFNEFSLEFDLATCRWLEETLFVITVFVIFWVLLLVLYTLVVFSLKYYIYKNIYKKS